MVKHCIVRDKNFLKVQEALGNEDRAEYFNSFNNGYPYYLNPEGKNSFIYDTIGQINVNKAIELRYKLMDYDLLQLHGNWTQGNNNIVLENGEPKLFVKVSTKTNKEVLRPLFTLPRVEVQQHLFNGEVFILNSLGKQTTYTYEDLESFYSPDGIGILEINNTPYYSFKSSNQLTQVNTDLVRTLKSKEIPFIKSGKEYIFSYTNEENYLKALEKWEQITKTNKLVFNSIEEATKAKDMIQGYFSTYSLKIIPITSNGKQLYIVTANKPKIEQVEDYLTRIEHEKNEAISKWWDNLSDDEKLSENMLIERADEGDSTFALRKLRDEDERSSIAFFDNTKNIKTEQDIINALRLFQIIDNSNNIKNEALMNNFIDVLLQYDSSPLIGNNNGKVYINNKILNYLNTLSSWDDINMTMASLFSEEIYYSKNEGYEDTLFEDEPFENEEYTGEPVPSTAKYNALIKSYKFQKEHTFKRLASVKSKINKLEKQLSQSSEVEKESLLSDILAAKERYKLLQLSLEKLEESTQKIKRAKHSNNILTLFNEGNESLQRLESIANTSDLTMEDLVFADKVSQVWRALGDPKAIQADGHHLFLTDEEVKDKTLFLGYTDENGVYHKGLTTISQEMEIAMLKINEKKTDLVLKAAQKELQDDTLTKEELLKAMKDIPYIQSLAYSISRVDDNLMTFIHKTMQKAIISARDESLQTLKEFEELVNKVKEKYGKDWDKMFLQEGQDGYDLVDLFKPEFFKNRLDVFLKAKRAKNYSIFKQYRDENELLFDPELLFPENGTINNSKEREAFLQLIKDNVGEHSFEYYYDLQRDKINQYRTALEIQEAYIDTLDLTREEKKNRLDYWKLLNSPYIYYKAYQNNKLNFEDGLMVKHNVFIPLKNKGWYDSKFETIMQDEDTRNLYNYISSLLKDLRSIIPSEERQKIKRNSLPDLRAELLSGLFSGQGTFGVSTIVDKIIEYTTQKPYLGVTQSQETDILTNKTIKKVRTPYLGDKENFVKEQIKLRSIKYKVDNKTSKVPEEIIVQWKGELSKEYYKNRKYNLETLLQLYTVQVLSYKHKSNVEGMLNFATQLMFNRGEIKEEITGQHSEERGELKQLQKLLEYSMDVWKGYPSHAVEGATKQKILTSTEKKYKEEYEQAISNLTLRKEQLLNINKDHPEIAELESQIAEYELKIKQLGSPITVSQVGTALTYWYTLLGMGFNVIAGGVNLVIGYLENSTRAADGRLFNLTDLHVAYKDVFSLIGNKLVPTGTGKKIIAINNKFHLVSKSMNELYNIEESSWLNKIKGKAKWLNPMIVNEVTEFQNQMPLILARLRTMKAYDIDGNEVSYWDAFDDDANIKEGYRLSKTLSNKDALQEMELHLVDLINRTHGNYKQTEAKLFKKDLLYRMLFQFRGWMPEGISGRWGKEEYSKLLGITTKGRYRSYSTLFKGSDLGDKHYSGLSNTLFTMKQLLRKMSFGLFKTQFNERMSEVDAANMRANMQELAILFSTMGLALLATSAIEPDDRKKYRINIALNLLSRMQTDIFMYMNPTAYQKISKNILPILSLLDNMGRFLDRFSKYLGDTSDENYNKMLKALARNFPITAQGVRWNDYSESVF